MSSFRFSRSSSRLMNPSSSCRVAVREGEGEERKEKMWNERTALTDVDKSKKKVILVTFPLALNPSLPSCRLKVPCRSRCSIACPQDVGSTMDRTRQSTRSP